MKRIVPLLLLLILVAVSAGAQGSKEWIKYTSAEGHYSVLVPVEPTLSTQEAANPEGEKFSQYLASAPDAGVLVLTGYFDLLPGGTYSLDKARDGMVAAVKGTLISESEISLDGSPGRALKVSAKDPDGVEYLVRARVYRVDKRVYVLQFIAPKATDDSATAEKAAKYFDSFVVNKTL